MKKRPTNRCSKCEHCTHNTHISPYIYAYAYNARVNCITHFSKYKYRKPCNNACQEPQNDNNRNEW